MIKKTASYFFLGLLCAARSIYGAPANTVVATINVGVTPAGIAVTSNNLVAYVANNNNYGITNGDNVSVLNLTNNTLTTTINDASFSQPYTVTLSKDGTKAYVTNSFGTTITIINTATNTVIGTITGLNGPSGMVITPDGNTAYVNNYGADGASGTGTTVSVVNLNTNTITGTITVGLAPASLAITPDGAFVYVINYVDGNTGTGTISIIRTSDNTVVGPTIHDFSGPFAIVITSNGKFAYVTNFGSNNFNPIGTTVSVVDLTTNTITTTINLDIQPAGIAITPDGKYAYATNYNSLYSSTGSDFDLAPGQGTVNIIDTATNTVIPPIIAVGQSPANVAISPDGEFAYVTNYTSGTVSVIALQSFQIVARGSQIRNRFLNFVDIVNQLTWTVTGTSLPINYSIYRDAGLTELAGTVPATGPLTFADHYVTAGVTYTYYIVGTNAAGTTSDPVVVTIG